MSAAHDCKYSESSSQVMYVLNLFVRVAHTVLLREHSHYGSHLPKLRPGAGWNIAIVCASMVRQAFDVDTADSHYLIVFFPDLYSPRKPLIWGSISWWLPEDLDAIHLVRALSLHLTG